MKVQLFKTLLLSAIALTTLNSKVMAQQEKKYKEVKVYETSKIINISADSLWKIVKEFDNVGVFFSGIDHAEGSGLPEFEGATCSERTCYVNLKGYSEVHEKLTIFELLDVENNSGIELTENLSMYPAASVSGLYFASAEAKYFSVGCSISIVS